MHFWHYLAVFRMHIPITPEMKSFQCTDWKRSPYESEPDDRKLAEGTSISGATSGFAGGVLVAERIAERFRYAKLHWRQSILLMEILILLVVGFMPAEMNMGATALVSFACAMQVQAFRKVDGYAYASTMCIGNLRSGMAALSAFMRNHKSSSWSRWDIILV